MKYLLIGIKKYCIEISQDHFERLKTAKKNLLSALYFEENLNLVLGNYVELEQDLFNISLNSMLFDDIDWSSSIGELRTIDRRIVNLLSSCRLYVDQACHNICGIYGTGSGQESAVKSQLRQEYDSNLGYRAMEAMRNYVQHRGLPVHGLTSGSHLIRSKAGEFRKHTVKLSIKIGTLKEDSKFKPRILGELQNMGDSVELLSLIRLYLESIGRIHLKVREMLASDLQQWQNSIQDCISDYHRSTGFDDGLRAAVYDGSNQLAEEISVFKGLFERRQMLEDKNRFLTHYSFHFVSNEAPELDT